MIAIDEEFHMSAGKEIRTHGTNTMCIFSTKYCSPILATETFVEINKAVSCSSSQPPTRTQVKPHSPQPSHLPQWAGKTLGRRF